MKISKPLVVTIAMMAFIVPIVVSPTAVAVVPGSNDSAYFKQSQYCDDLFTFTYSHYGEEPLYIKLYKPTGQLFTSLSLPYGSGGTYYYSLNGQGAPGWWKCVAYYDTSVVRTSYASLGVLYLERDTYFGYPNVKTMKLFTSVPDGDWFTGDVSIGMALNISYQYHSVYDQDILYMKTSTWIEDTDNVMLTMANKVSIIVEKSSSWSQGVHTGHTTSYTANTYYSGVEFRNGDPIHRGANGLKYSGTVSWQHVFMSGAIAGVTSLTLAGITLASGGTATVAAFPLLMEMGVAAGVDVLDQMTSSTYTPNNALRLSNDNWAQVDWWKESTTPGNFQSSYNWVELYTSPKSQYGGNYIWKVTLICEILTVPVTTFISQPLILVMVDT